MEHFRRLPRAKEEIVMRILLSTACLLLAAALFPPAPMATASSTEAKYVGVKTCSKCHKKKKQGEQYKIWLASDHAQAYETLGGGKAKKKAATLGISGNPQRAEACLICHTTGSGEPKSRFDRKFKISNGVQCETCHGAGSLYKKKKIMKQIYKERGPHRKGKSPTAEETEARRPNEKTCTRCHAKQITWKGKTFKNPSYKPFNFKERFDKIKHPVPSR